MGPASGAGTPNLGYDYPGRLRHNGKITKQIVYLTVKSGRVPGMGLGRELYGD